MGIGPRVYKREEMERNICTHMYVYGVGPRNERYGSIVKIIHRKNGKLYLEL